MTSSSVTRKSLGLFGILGGFLCEAAAALPFVAPEVIWVSAEQSLLVHLLGGVLFGGGASALISGGRSFGQWVGPAVLFTLLSVMLPMLGILVVLTLTIILISHHAQLPQEEISLVEVSPVRTDRESSLYGPGPISQPLVSLLSMLGQFREAAITVEQLRHTAGLEQNVARLRSRLDYDRAAAQNVFAPPASAAGLENQQRSAL